MHPFVTYTPCATSSREQTGDVITFKDFEEMNLLSETRNDTENSNESENVSIMPPLLSEKEMDAMDYGNESDHDPMSMEVLEDIRDGIQYHPNVNRRQACYKIRDHIKQRQSEWKAALKSTPNMGKGLQKVFKTAVKEILQDLLLGEYGLEFLH